MSNERIILGIDPGTQVTGYGIVSVTGSQTRLLSVGIIDMRKKKDANERLKTIFQTVSQLISDFKVTEFAVEAPFFGKNVQSMLKLGKAQGVAIAAALSKNLDPKEYSPRKVKLAVTGNGNASKEQVAVFLEKLLNQNIDVHTQDATDGLAVAVCHAFRPPSASESEYEKAGSWKAFINKNPNRIIR